jgi:cytochrome P450
MLKTIPDHVPASVVREFDYFHQPELLKNPHDAVEKVFADLDPRILFTPSNGGHWIIGGYKELVAAFRDAKTFSSTSMQIPEMADEVKLIPLNLDPPDHAKYRAPIQAALQNENMLLMEGQIRELARELIDDVRDKGETEFVYNIGEPLPSLILLRILGVRKEKFRGFRESVKAFMTTAEDRPAVAARFDVELEELVKEKQENPGDDLVSALVRTEIDGKPVDHETLIAYVRLLLLAGLDTVTNAMCFGMRHLAGDHALQEELRQDPSRIPRAAEELLRRYSIASLGRIVAQDAEFFGLQFRKGDRVLLMVPGGGIDPSAYDDPETVDIDRSGRAQPAFGFARHHCLGVHLARLELKILYEEWLSGLPPFRIKEGTTPHFHGGLVLGVENLQLEWGDQ